MKVVESPGNESFIKFLLSVGDIEEATLKVGINNNYISVPNNYSLKVPKSTKVDELELLIKEIHSNLDSFSRLDPEYFIGRVILTTLNRDANKPNDLAANPLGNRESLKICTFQDAISKETLTGNNSTEYLNSLSPSSFPLSKLGLKVGHSIALIKLSMLPMDYAMVPDLLL